MSFPIKKGESCIDRERLCSSHEIIFRVNLLTRDMISSCGKNQVAKMVSIEERRSSKQ